MRYKLKQKHLHGMSVLTTTKDPNQIFIFAQIHCFFVLLSPNIFKMVGRIRIDLLLVMMG